MRRRVIGFTITELLIVLAVLALLSAILFPVFRSARESAKRAVCSSNFRQSNYAAQLYLADYNDYFMPVNYDINSLNNPAKDRTWVQLLLPYTRGLQVFTCPSDYGEKEKWGKFDADLVIGDPYQRYYAASMRSNVGYNYLYFSPVYQLAGRWVVQPRSFSEIVESATALLFVDSVYSRTSSGYPKGGGSYIVLPPCRYMRSGSNVPIDTFNVNSAPVYGPNQGWVVSDPVSPFVFGLAWPWHFERMNVSHTSGGTVSIAKHRLSEGCNVRNNWSGLIDDNSKYSWDFF